MDLIHGRMSGSEECVNTRPTLTLTALLTQERIMAENQPTAERPSFQPLAERATPHARNFLFRLPERLTVSEAECWLWTGATASNGYGTVAFRDGGKKKMRPLHRLVYELCVAPIPEGLNVLHNCPGGDNPRCCNPAHLFLGTQLENVHDCMNKGRLTGRRSAPVGSLNPNAKLDDATVNEIRRRVATGPRGMQKLLEAELGVSRATISRVVRGERWQHVDGFPVFGDGGGI